MIEKEIQTKLASMGHYDGPIDGILGPGSKAGILAALQTPVVADVPTVGSENYDKLLDELRLDEGFRPYAYQDKFGYWTIGYGRLVDKKKGGGISKTEAESLLRNDVLSREAYFKTKYPAYNKLSPNRQRAALNMAFQLGKDWPAEFIPTWYAVEAGNFATVAANLRKSLWSKQTPERAERVIKLWENG